MIALILGGAPSWLQEAEAAAKLLNRRHMVVAANLAGIHWPGPLDGWASLHADLLPGWAQERRGRAAGRLFAPDTTPERWPGSSGLYALQCALFELGASGAILCGIPQDNAAGSINHPGPWNGGDDYRRACRAALPEIGGRARSMGGWTAELFGRPTQAWAGAIQTIKPPGRSAPKETPMFKITNVSDAAAKFWARNDNGSLELVWLDPGKSTEANIDPRHRVFAEGGSFKVTTPRAAAPKKAARTGPAKTKAARTAPSTPQTPAEPQGNA